MSHNLLFTLPRELFFEVSEYLPPRSLANLALSCSALNALLNPLLNRHFSKDADRILLWSVYQDHPDILSRILALGTPIPLPSRRSVSIFLYAIYHGRTDVVRVFIAQRANREVGRGAQIRPGRMPVLCCVARGHVEVTRLLLEAGADVNRPHKPRGAGSITPLDVAEGDRLDPVKRETMIALLKSWGGVRYCDTAMGRAEFKGKTLPSSSQG